MMKTLILTVTLGLMLVLASTAQAREMVALDTETIVVKEGNHLMLVKVKDGKLTIIHSLVYSTASPQPQIITTNHDKINVKEPDDRY